MYTECTCTCTCTLNVHVHVFLKLGRLGVGVYTHPSSQAQNHSMPPSGAYEKKRSQKCAIPT